MWTLIIAAAAASTGAPTAMADAGGGKHKADRIICKSFPRTESRLGRNRICRLRSEWEDVQREQERELDQLKIDNTIMLKSDGVGS